jgi:hypothetical protein
MRARLLRTQDRVFGCFGYAELHDFLGPDLNRLTSIGIAADTNFAIDQHKFTETWDSERILGVFIGPEY